MYNILTVFVIPMEILIPTKMCLKENYSMVCVCKHSFVVFIIRNSLKKEMLYHHGFEDFF